MTSYADIIKSNSYTQRRFTCDNIKKIYIKKDINELYERLTMSMFFEKYNLYKLKDILNKYFTIDNQKIYFYSTKKSNFLTIHFYTQVTGASIYRNCINLDMFSFEIPIADIPSIIETSWNKKLYSIYNEELFSKYDKVFYPSTLNYIENQNITHYNNSLVSRNEFLDDVDDIKYELFTQFLPSILQRTVSYLMKLYCKRPDESIFFTTNKFSEEYRKYKELNNEFRSLFNYIILELNVLPEIESISFCGGQDYRKAKDSFESSI
jgi:hypothetical protein